jgi:hypothetical protein
MIAVAPARDDRLVDAQTSPVPDAGARLVFIV